MHAFRDALDRDWTVQVNVAQIKRVRAALGVELHGVTGDGLPAVVDLLNDPCRLCDVLYVLVKEQADARKLTDEDFGTGMGGDALGAGADALVKAIVDFFQSPGQRKAVGDLLSKGRELGERAAAKLSARVAAADLDALAERLLGSPHRRRRLAARLAARRHRRG
jgi:hypothetical protein